MLKEYNSKPCKILACEIQEGCTIEETDEGCYVYTHKGKGAVTDKLEFTASVEPEVGDFIIQQNKKDIYHCPKDVFNAKYSIAGMYIR